MMRKEIIIIAIVLLFGFAPSDSLTHEGKIKISSQNKSIVQEIKVIDGIIDEKLEKARQLEIQGIIFLEKDKDSRIGMKLIEEAKLERMMTLKYKAAIACKTHFLK